MCDLSKSVVADICRVRDTALAQRDALVLVAEAVIESQTQTFRICTVRDNGHWDDTGFTVEALSWEEAEQYAESNHDNIEWYVVDGAGHSSVSSAECDCELPVVNLTGLRAAVLAARGGDQVSTETTTEQKQAISAECASGRHWQGWVLGHCDGTRYNYKAMAKDGPCGCQCHAEVSK